MSLTYGKPVIVLLPNQVYSEIGLFARKEVPDNGYAFAHDVHYSFHFERIGDLGKGNYDVTGLVSDYVTEVSLAKSKFSPEFKSICAFIDGKAGGRIDPELSLILQAIKLGYLRDNSGWYPVLLEKDSVQKNLRWSDVILQKEVVSRQLLQIIQLDMIRNYPLIRLLYQELGWTEMLASLDASQSVPSKP